MRTEIILLMSAFLAVGCSKSNNHSPETKQSTFEGRYVEVDDPEEFIELRDGTFFWRSSGESLHGNYKLDGTNLFLLLPLGQVEELTVNGNALLSEGFEFQGHTIFDEYVRQE